MSVFAAYPNMDRALGLEAEIATRLRDLLTRKVGPVERGLDSAVQAMERAVQKGLSFRGLKDRLVSVREWLRRSQSTVDTEETRELAILIERVMQHGKTTSIENYSAFLFSVDSI